MRILYIHQHFATHQGTSGTRSFEIAQALVAHGHSVVVLCGSTNHTGLHSEFNRFGIRSGEVNGIQVIEIQVNYSNHYSFLKRSLSFMKFAVFSLIVALKEKYDVIFATSTPLTVAIPGIAARVIRKKRFVFEVRDLWPELPRAMGVIKNPIVLWLMSTLESLAYWAADEIVALAPGIMHGIRKNHFGKRRRVVMIPNGSDLELFVPTPERNLREHPFSPQKTLAVFTGAHGIANGLDNLIDTAHLLNRDENNRIQIALIGDGKLKPLIEQRATTLGLENVLFLDPMPKTKLAALLPQCDVGLMILANVPAFYYGTSPNKFFDYISSGLPVVCNYHGWLADLIQEHDCGIAVPPNDAEALAGALIRLAQNPAEIARMGINARRLAECKFGRKDLAKQLVNLLENPNGENLITTGEECLNSDKWKESIV